MLSKLNKLILDCSRTWWKFLIVVLVQTGSLLALQRISNDFPAASGGVPPFDMQNMLRPAEIFEQLEGYTEQAFDLYIIFQAIDFVFPFFASLMLASVCAFCLRHISITLYEQFVAKKLFLLLLMPAIFDYLENISLLWAVNAWPEQVQIAATLAVAAKMGKLTAMMVVFALAGMLLLVMTLRWTGRRLGIWGKAEPNGG